MLALESGALLLSGDVDGALETARTAVEVATAAGAGAEGAAGVAHAYLVLMRVVRGEPDPGQTLVGDVDAVAGLSRGSDEALETVLPCFVWLEDYERARRLIDLLAEAARSTGALPVVAHSLHWRAELDARLGRWSSAYAASGEAESLSREMRQTTGLAFILASRARIEAGLGHEADCRAHVAEALALAGACGAAGARAHALGALGLLELGAGSTDEAIAALLEATREFDDHQVREPGLTRCAPDLIEALVRAGRAGEAQAALERFAADAIATRRRSALAAVARCRALLAEADELDGAVADALRAHEQLAMPFERARTELCLGERLRRTGRRVDARALLRSALDTFDRIGALPWAERVRTELRASGATARRGEAALSNELTGQELQVALLVAQGATNREAAVALYLSPKTIEVHLGRVYRKLGIRSRVALSRMLAREGTLVGAIPTAGSPG
jgi:DNA-binding CsgD family transcriptional regulator